MPKFSVNTQRFDPYLNFKFKVKWDGQYVAGLSKCSALKKTTEVTPWYESGDQASPRQVAAADRLPAGNHGEHHQRQPGRAREPGVEQPEGEAIEDAAHAMRSSPASSRSTRTGGPQYSRPACGPGRGDGGGPKASGAGTGSSPPGRPGAQVVPNCP